MRHRASVPGSLFVGGSAIASALAIVAFAACGGTGNATPDLSGGDDGTGATAGTSSAAAGHAGKSAGAVGGSGGHAGSISVGLGGQTTGTGGGGTGGSSAGTAGTSTGGTTGGSPSTGGAGGSTAGASGAAGTGGTSSPGAGGSGATGGSSPSTGGTSSTGGTGPAMGQGGSAPACGANPNADMDNDGYTPAQGDCNDCDPATNPGAIDVLQVDANGVPLPNQTDNDCDGVLPSMANQECGDGLKIDSTDPMDGAKAMDICKVYDPAKNSWGVISADYENLNTSPLPGGDAQLGHGILSGFGPNVHTKLGPNFFALSSGTARQPNDPGYQDVGGFDKGYDSTFLPGFPIESPACPGVMTGQPEDGILLRLQIKVPTNAKSFSFNFKFYTYEYPGYICSEFNDFFVVLMDPPPSDVNPQNENIIFDSMKNPVSVNNAFLDVCQPGNHGGKNFPCAGNIAELQGTGFQGHGATSWLKTTASVVPGSTITLGFAAWDSGDHILDSTGIVDNFRWSATPAMGTVTEKP